MTEKKKTTAAHMRATAKYEAANYDKVLVRLPKGTKARITATGSSVNGFINHLVLSALNTIEEGQNEK